MLALVLDDIPSCSSQDPPEYSCLASWLRTQVFVKTLTGKTLTFDVSRDHTVEQLKQQIRGREGRTTHEWHLIFAGKQLEDGRLLSEYGIQQESTVHMVLRLNGC
jgi:hypothetical protein